jgi:hypothetical protein
MIRAARDGRNKNPVYRKNELRKETFELDDKRKLHLHFSAF